jgi:hypothetical protein
MPCGSMSLSSRGPINCVATYWSSRPPVRPTPLTDDFTSFEGFRELFRGHWHRHKPGQGQNYKKTE